MTEAKDCHRGLLQQDSNTIPLADRYRAHGEDIKPEAITINFLFLEYGLFFKWNCLSFVPFKSAMTCTFHSLVIDGLSAVVCVVFYVIALFLTFKCGLPRDVV